MARLIVLMIGVILVLLGFILAPAAWDAKEEKMRQLDELYVSTAERIAKEQLLMEGTKAFEAVYDAETKTFFEPEDYKKIKPYGEMKEHKGKFLLLRFKAEEKAGEKADNADEAIFSAWVSPDEMKVQLEKQKKKA